MHFATWNNIYIKYATREMYSIFRFFELIFQVLFQVFTFFSPDVLVIWSITFLSHFYLPNVLKKNKDDFSAVIFWICQGIDFTEHSLFLVASYMTLQFTIRNKQKWLPVPFFTNILTYLLLCISLTLLYVNKHIII